MQDQDFLITTEFIKNGNKLNEFLQGLINLENDINDLESTIESQDKNNIFVIPEVVQNNIKNSIKNSTCTSFFQAMYCFSTFNIILHLTPQYGSCKSP